jgi:1,5-anhydro-D-fructose reductase (1,5-anhydro-D-mannitol-forming)
MTLSPPAATDTSQPTPLKIGLLSLAHVHATTYVDILRARSDIEVCVADPDATAADRSAVALAHDAGINVVATYDDLFAWKPDGVIICAENSRHRELVELAARHGIPILCEKPIATTIEDACAMVDACAATRTPLMIAMPVRFHPAMRSIRTRLASGDLGAVKSAVGTNTSKAPIDSRPWFADAHLAGGGALMDHIVHLTDLIDSLIGVAPLEVYAQSNRIIHGDRVTVETGGIIIVTYIDGTVVTIDCSWSAPNSYPSWGGLTLALECEHGSVEFDAFNGRLDLYDDQIGTLEWLDYDISLDALMLDEFLAAIRSRSRPEPTGEAGLRSLKIALAAYESTMTGQPAPV